MACRNLASGIDLQVSKSLIKRAVLWHGYINPCCDTVFHFGNKASVPVQSVICASG